MFEADIFVPLTAYNGFAWPELIGGESGLNIYLTPRNIFRVMNDFSGPLRSPSFMPRFDIQYIWSFASDPSRFQGTPVVGVTITHAHHSNGGSNCLFVEEGPIEDSAEPFGYRCEFPPGSRLDAVTVNSRGSFSTNFWRIQPSFAYLWLRPGPQRVGKLLAASPFLELHPLGMEFLYLFGGKTESNQRAVYGPSRAGIRLEGEHELSIFGRPGRVALNAEITRILDDRRNQYNPDWARTVVDAAASYMVDSGTLQGWGVVARFYDGQDYYNLDMVRDVRRFDVGLYIHRGIRRPN
jgi:hypothetical protein